MRAEQCLLRWACANPYLEGAVMPSPRLLTQIGIWVLSNFLVHPWISVPRKGEYVFGKDDKDAQDNLTVEDKAKSAVNVSLTFPFVVIDFM